MSDPAVDIQQLDPAYPIALLPVRIETRFVAGGSPQLLVRVYPDEIAAELGSLLTSDTAEAGRQFWREGWQFADELDAWRRLVQRYPGHVAGAIVDAQRPTNFGDRPAGEPFWEDPPEPPTAETATTRVLPDCWIAVGYRNGVEELRYTGAAIVEPLALSFRRDVADDDPTLIDHDGLRVEPALLWTVDFDQAVAVGMGLRIPIDGDDLAQGFDRLVVFGVKTTLSATAGKERLIELLDSHRRSRGLALVRQGTPTNNSAEGDAGYPPPDDADRSFAIERGAPLTADGSDGEALAKALGVPGTVFEHVEGADRLEQRRARAMNQALWPCTLGYFLEEMMSPLVGADMRAAIRDHYVAYVRGRGPLPAFRVGRVPYGILPVTPLVGAVEAFETTLVARLADWQLRVLEAAANVARVGRTPGDPDADLLGVLAVDASCREVRQRELVGPAYMRAVLDLFGADPHLGEATRATFTGDVLLALGLELQASPRVASMTFADEALRINRPLVSPEPLSEDAPLADDYIAAMCTAATVFDLSPPGPPPAPDLMRPLLYHLLRQGTLVEYGDVATALAIDDSVAEPVDRREVELYQISPGTLGRLSPNQRFAAPLSMTGTAALGEWILDLPSDPAADDGRERVRRHLAALEQLVAVPTAELERLMTETLDTCSHRLDAWHTSLATRRLTTMRAAHSDGIYLGAYAFVENLRARTVPLPGAVGGFIHAPSATHAAAAAVLRNGYLTRDGAEEVAIDLSSQRVRRALALADGVRQGQPPGAVLGYWFERALHDLELDRYIAPFRRLYPLGRLPGVSFELPAEQIAARNVVNGLALRDARLTWTTLPWGVIGKLPIVDDDDRAGVLACLDQLDADVDAAADLFAAESVYQIVQGNTDRAAANLASGAGTGSLPLPGIITPPTSGTAFTHRVAIVLGAPTLLLWPAAGARRLAEPRLDAWFGTRLGDPAVIWCRALHDQGETVVTVQALGLSALDFVMLARGGDELAARVIAHVRATVGGFTGAIAIDFGRPTNPPWPLTVFSVDEALETARLAGELVGGARPLTGDDVVPPHDAGAPFTIDTTEMDGRVLSALTQFELVRAAVDAAVAAAGSPTPPAGSLDDLRAALWSAAGFGVREAVPVELAGDDAAVRAALLVQAAIVQAELARRAAVAAAAAPVAVDTLAALFGPELPILVPFTPANRPDLDTALANPPGIPFETRLWLQRMARIREPLDRLRLAHLASDAMTGAALSPTGFFFDIAQLPFQLGALWIGQAFDPNAEWQRPRAGTVAIAMHRPDGFDLTGSWAGLLVDDWTETIPSTSQLTSYAIHHQAPGAEAPQCVVLAVPPQNPDITTWALWIVEACIEQTFDLARMRAVDSDLLHPYALLAPCVYLAANVADDAIRSPLGEMCIKEAEVLAPE